MLFENIIEFNSNKNQIQIITEDALSTHRAATVLTEKEIPLDMMSDSITPFIDSTVLTASNRIVESLDLNNNPNHILNQLDLDSPL